MEFFLILLVVGLVCGAISASIADSRGASMGLGFLAGFLLGPIGILVAFLMERKPPSDASANFNARPDVEKVCPRCAERIKAAAVVCRYCGHEFAADDLSVASVAVRPVSGTAASPQYRSPAVSDDPLATEPQESRLEQPDGLIRGTIASLAIIAVLVTLFLLLGPSPTPLGIDAPVNTESYAENLEATADNLEATADAAVEAAFADRAKPLLNVPDASDAPLDDITEEDSDAFDTTIAADRQDTPAVNASDEGRGNENYVGD